MKKKVLLMLISSFVMVNLVADDRVLVEEKEVGKIDPYPYIHPIAVEFARVTQVKKQKKFDKSDKDGDGVLDKNDKCPETKIGEKVNKDGCPVQLDDDNDGVANNLDQCSNTPIGAKVDKYGCEFDSDKDGVVDSKDRCPNTSKNFMVDSVGCPKTATLKINFKRRKASIDEHSLAYVEDFATFLKKNRDYGVVIYGYTDSRGKAKDNKVLSQKRAESVKEMLVKFGINPLRLSAIGRGEENPVADNSTKEGRAKNRRIEVKLLK